DPFLTGAVKVAIRGNPCLHAGRNYRVRELVLLLMIRHLKRTPNAMKLILTALLIFRSPKIRQHLVEAPTSASALTPLVVIARVPANVYEPIYRASSTQDLASRLIGRAAIEFNNRFAVKHPIDLRVRKEHRVTQRRANPESTV